MAEKDLDPSSRVDQLVEELIGSGKVSHGQFTLAPSEARKKLETHLLADPLGYVVLLARAALARDADRIEFKTSERHVLMEFNGRPFGRHDLERMYDAAMAGEGADYPAGLRELGLGLVSAVNLEFQKIRLIAGDGKKAVVLELSPGEEDRLLEVDKKLEGTRIHVKGRLPEARGLWLTDMTRPEDHLVRHRLQYVSSTVLLNDAPVSFGLALDSAEAPVTVKEAGVSGVAGYLPEESDRPAVRVLKNRVWVATVPLIEAEFGDYGFTAVLETEGIRLDLSESQVIEKGDAYEAMLSAARRANTASSAKFDTAGCEGRLDSMVGEGFKKVRSAMGRPQAVVMAVAVAVVLPIALPLIYQNLPASSRSGIGPLVFGMVMFGFLTTIGTVVACYLVLLLSGAFVNRGARTFRRLFPPKSRIRRVALGTSTIYPLMQKVIRSEISEK